MYWPNTYWGTTMVTIGNRLIKSHGNFIYKVCGLITKKYANHKIIWSIKMFLKINASKWDNKYVKNGYGELELLNQDTWTTKTVLNAESEIKSNSPC